MSRGMYTLEPPSPPTPTPLESRTETKSCLGRFEKLEDNILAPAKEDVDRTFDGADIPWLKELLGLLEGRIGHYLHNN